MKRRILIFGASGSGKMVLSTLSKDTEIIGFMTVMIQVRINFVENIRPRF